MESLRLLINGLVITSRIGNNLHRWKNLNPVFAIRSVVYHKDLHFGPLLRILYINDLPMQLAPILIAVCYLLMIPVYISRAKRPEYPNWTTKLWAWECVSLVNGKQIIDQRQQTKLMFYRPGQKSLPYISPFIIDNNVVEIVPDTIQYLGVSIDQHRRWKTHTRVLSERSRSL